MTVRVYVAGPSAPAHRKRMRSFTDAAKAVPGVVVTHDWIARVEALGPDHGLSADTLRPEALADLRGVEAADVLMVLTFDGPVATSGGALVELGYALALGRRVVQVGPQTPHLCFGTLLSERFDDEGALRWLRALARSEDDTHEVAL